MKTWSALRQRGQAMTEFVVAAAFVLVPLFLIVPTAGKYIDMKLATVQAARYASWEYTANYVKLNDQPGGFEALSRAKMPRKTQDQVAAEARRRHFSKTELLLSSTLDKEGYVAGDDANPMWHFYNGLPMYLGPDKRWTQKGSEPSPARVAATAFGAIGKGLGIFGSGLQALGLDVGFDVMNPDETITIDGLFTANVRIGVEEAPDYTALDANSSKPLFGQNLNLEMTANSGILTESWAAGGRDHTMYQAGALVPSALFEPVFQPFQKLLGWVSPELNPSSLKFGYPVGDTKDIEHVMDQVPPGALEGDPDNIKVDCPGGYCEN